MIVSRGRVRRVFCYPSLLKMLHGFCIIGGIIFLRAVPVIEDEIEKTEPKLCFLQHYDFEKVKIFHLFSTFFHLFSPLLKQDKPTALARVA